MTAATDEARARATSLVEAIRESYTAGDSDTHYDMTDEECIAMVETAITEARIQGAHDALKPSPHLDEMVALSQEMGLYDTPAIAPLREAVVEAAMSEHAAWLAYNDAMDRRNPAAALGDAYSQAAGKRRDACAALAALGLRVEGEAG